MKRALVVGSSQDVWQEVEAAQKLCTFNTYYVVKMTGIHWDQGFFYWVTLHPEFMAKYREERTKLGLDNNYQIVSCLQTECGRHGEIVCDRHVSYRFPGMRSSGASGLFAIKVALDDGHGRVVCAGMPMTKESGHFARGKPWEFVDDFKIGWNAAKPHIIGKVRSMSGWSMEFLGGPPTPEWLAEPRDAEQPEGVTPV